MGWGSINGGTPKSSISMGFSLVSHPFWRTPTFPETLISLLKLDLWSYTRFPDKPIRSIAGHISPWKSHSIPYDCWYIVGEVPMIIKSNENMRYIFFSTIHVIPMILAWYSHMIPMIIIITYIWEYPYIIMIPMIIIIIPTIFPYYSHMIPMIIIITYIWEYPYIIMIPMIIIIIPTIFPYYSHMIPMIIIITYIWEYPYIIMIPMIIIIIPTIFPYYSILFPYDSHDITKIFPYIYIPIFFHHPPWFHRATRWRWRDPNRWTHTTWQPTEALR